MEALVGKDMDFVSFRVDKRKRKLRISMSASGERAKIMNMKVEMEQQIQALEEQIIHLEKIALIASNSPQQIIATLSSPVINKLGEPEAGRQAPVLHMHSRVSETERLMLKPVSSHSS